MNSYQAVLIFDDGASFRPFRTQEFKASDDEHARSLAARWASADASALYACTELRLYRDNFLIWFARVRGGAFAGQCNQCRGIGEITPGANLGSEALASALEPIPSPTCCRMGLRRSSSAHLAPRAGV